jgi:hypothetical protein
MLKKIEAMQDTFYFQLPNVYRFHQLARRLVSQFAVLQNASIEDQIDAR